MTSRRKAEQLIADGAVQVNGLTITDPATIVTPERDQIKVNGKLLAAEEKVYILLNKPAGYISSVNDPHGRKTVLDLLPDIGQRLFPVGRLDYDTEGLLLLTNDGDFANLMMHPRFEVSKVYQAVVKGCPSAEDMERLRRGIEIEGEQTAPAGIKIIKRYADESLVELEIHEGRKRQVKRMMGAVGCPVRKLTRIRYAFLDLTGVSVGAFRHLKPGETDRLQREARARVAKKKGL